MAASAEATVLERAPELAETAPDIFEALAKAPGAAEAFGAAAAQHYLSLLGGTPGEFAKSTSTGPVASPKSWFADPYSLLDSVGIGYRNTPSYVTYDTLRKIAERDTLVAAIILTRANQVAAFARPQENKYSVGFDIRLRNRADRHRRLRADEKTRRFELETFVRHTGRDADPGRDSFETFLRKFVRDRLTYDQSCFETVMAYDRRPHSFLMVPSDTIRIANPRNERGTPPTLAQQRSRIAFVQMINGGLMTEYTTDELAFCVANPRTNIKSYGYGLPEPEILMTTVTAHMWAEEWNRRAFSQGSTIKSIINLRGNIPNNQFEAFKRQWTAQVSGITNAWKTPVVNTDGLEHIPLQNTNMEMGYNLWLEYLIKITCAIYQIDPSEINFDLRGGAGQQPVFVTTNEAQQEQSKDRGLRPLLRFIEDAINRHVIYRLDPAWEFAFMGLDAKSEEQAIELRNRQVSTSHTLNEIRELEDLPAIPDGDVVLNPTFTGYKAQKAMSAQMPGAGGGEEPPPQPGDLPFGKPPDDDDKQAGGGVTEAGTPKSKNQQRDAEQSYGLHSNDWESSVHASLPPEDLFKSSASYENARFYDAVEPEEWV